MHQNALKSLLADVKIVDLSRVLAGPFATMTLANLGARVIKVEMPVVGDDARAFGPFANGKSLYFSAINCNKESIALNLKRGEDRSIFEKLVSKADVLVENYRPGTMEKLGYGWDMLHDRFPQLIYGAVSGFGDTGPRSSLAAYDMVVQGMGGIMSVTGHPGGAPARVGVSIGDITAGLYLALGINAALYRRSLAGVGCKLDIAMLDCQAAIMEDAVTVYAKTGEAPGPLGTRHPTVAPFQAYAAADGNIIIAAGNDHLFSLATDVLGRPELARDPRFATNELRHRNVDALQAEIESVSVTRCVSYWLDALTAKGVPCAPINDIAHMMAEPQIVARNMIVRVADPVAGELSVAGNPVKVMGMPEPRTMRPAPELDADRAAIVAEFVGSGR
ncbi:CaiB/BaiF CoA transferase family protein [Burkholderia singularis]|uniref:L-carnitine dehydratase/bile acid-inducible protein F n=1 Tax=Burkholderia singularis TaxID=1503053 RepID=A0A238GYL3_9BURK|nr:CoA transferase [Burkholderia singularis]SMF98068.1 L-carnitine dehydratase/bile acid-inducible protein F [Burkholderia singularis]